MIKAKRGKRVRKATRIDPTQWKYKAAVHSYNIHLNQNKKK